MKKKTPTALIVHRASRLSPTAQLLPAICYLLSAICFCSRGANSLPPVAAFRPPPADERVVAQINGEKLLASELLSKLPPPGADSQAWQESKREALGTMVDRVLVLQLARKLGYQDSISAQLTQHTADLAVQMLRKYAQSVLTVTRADVVRESLLLYTNIHLKRIDVTTYDTAQMVATLLKKGVPFESLAARYSRARTAQPDGDMGFGPKSGVPPEVMNALKKLKPGGATGAMALGVNFDFIKYEGERMAPAESIKLTHEQLQSSAQRRKVEEYLRGLHTRVQYDERVLDRLTTDSADRLPPAAVVARLPDGSRTRVGDLLPMVKSYGDALPSAQRRSLKEHIENDALERELRRLRLDKTPVYQDQLKFVNDQVLYDFSSNRLIVTQAHLSDSDYSTYYHQHPDAFKTHELTPHDSLFIRAQLMPVRQQEVANALLEKLRKSAAISVDEQLLAALKPDTTAK